MFLAVWWWLGRDVGGAATIDLGGRLTSEPVATAARPEVTPLRPTRADVSKKWREKAAAHNQQAIRQRTPIKKQVSALIAAGKQALAGGDLIAARGFFTEALKLGASVPEVSFLRAELTKNSAETIFSPRVFKNDPFVERYIIQPGDSFSKIASMRQVSSDLLAAVNNIADKNRIRAGRTIKLIKGPFHAVITKSNYTLDVYLGDMFLKRYKVGLGADGSTPAGRWRVGTKLVNPTYYPPRGGRIVAADDPENPLAERWISLVGIGGEAVGQARYGIHGTTEPESIGTSSSLGCIRMHNEDVEELYMYLVERHSIVTIQ